MSADRPDNPWAPRDPGQQPPPSAYPPPPPAYPPPTPPGSGPPLTYGPPPGYLPRQTESTAVVAIVLAGASWLVCPFVLAIAALVVGANAQRRIDADPARLDGGQLVTAAKVIAWINIAVSVAVVVFVVFLALGAWSTGSFEVTTP